jgi:cellulose synthase/poly-beta-1,6-N-acetylglucosamine synthase-like glycosyltransferase
LVVQTRWGHLNRNYWLTKIQAFALDAHFNRTSRTKFKIVHHFNGNWCGESNVFWMEESDTLTEDLDLSYRAQLKNWEFKYLENVGLPAELPAIISAEIPI